MNIIFFDKFIELVQKEAQVLNNFILKQHEVSKAVKKRDWLLLEQAVEQAASLSEIISTLETERTKAWSNLLSDLELPNNSSVFKASLYVPLEKRNELNTSYRELRLAVAKAKIENGTISAIANEASKTLKMTMDAFFPENKGSLYCKSGTKRNLETSGMILNTAF